MIEIATKTIEDPLEDLEAAVVLEKNKFVEARVKEYLLKAKGNISTFESIEEENGEYFVSAKFDVKRDKTMYGFLARGLKMSIGSWPEKKSWDGVAQVIADMNGVRNFKVADGQTLRVPIKRIIDTTSWEEEFQKIRDALAAESALKDAEKEKEQEQTLFDSQHAREALDLQLDIHTSEPDATYTKPIEINSQDLDVSDFDTNIDEFFPKPEVILPPKKVLPENFKDFFLVCKECPKKQKDFIRRINLTLNKAKNASPFLPDSVFFDMKEALEKLLKNHSYVRDFEEDSGWDIEENMGFEDPSIGDFDNFCTRVRCGTTNRYLRQKKHFDIKENRYELFRGLTPTMKQAVYIFARDFSELGIQFYSEEKISFTLSGGKERREKNKLSYHEKGQAIDIRTNNILKEDLQQAAKYLEMFHKALDEGMKKYVTEFMPEDKRLGTYKETEDQTGPHLHFAIKEDITQEILEKISSQVRESFKKKS